MNLEHLLKGTLGEAKVGWGSLRSLPPSRYTRFNDVTLHLPDGPAQIDHVFVSRFGVFVIETKNWSGRIHGHPLDRLWTQVFPARSKRYENPLRQNRRHVKAVEWVLARLRLPAGAVRSVVAFVGDGRLGSGLPPNVTTGDGWARYIRSFRRPILSDRHVREICREISSARRRPTPRTRACPVGDLDDRRRVPPGRADRVPRPAAVRDVRSPYRSRLTGVARDEF